MRTTLTLDADLARALKERARETGQSFKEVTNSAIRLGLSLGEGPPASPEPFQVAAARRGFRPGVDPLKLNQTYDELEADRLQLGVHEP